MSPDGYAAMGKNNTRSRVMGTTPSQGRGIFTIERRKTMKPIAYIGQWCWSPCGERYNGPFKTRSEAIDDAYSEIDPEEFPRSIHIGQVDEVVSVVDAVVAGAMFDSGRLSEDAECWIGENYLTENEVIRSKDPEAWKKLEGILRAAVEMWAQDCGVQAHWFQVGNTKEIPIGESWAQP